MLDYFSAFCILLFLEIVLGIDNIIFISVVTSRLHENSGIRYFGLGLALFFRLVALFSVSTLLKLKQPVFYALSIQDVIFIIGGLFLSFKGLSEIIHDAKPKINNEFKVYSKLSAVLYIAFIDLVFSIDSLLTALAITQNMLLIALAFSVTIVFMGVASDVVSKWITLFPELKTLALVFITSIGIVLLFDGIHIEINKNYLYFAFGFSLIVQLCNIARKSISLSDK
ncbi:integral membrane TerC family protein [Neorickettsia helminthoeca str. Oregon]|uniref:Integral membrane TerC family protein n=1 Tax=Neorickettsia helminthoeca str. Oregon TaxID=1286528 RepID=X5HMI6_9RICK|nr:DUF475 domain-containing protein [Neorickettsia helminthoeca]AHX11685.1 integral membrane TerC family protein [Neorickettsia helminthoeca str. Oregon]